MTCGICQLRPESRGTILIASPDVIQPPRIKPHYLSVQADQMVTVAGLRAARRILAQPALDGLRGQETSPGAELTHDDGLLSYARETGKTLYHPVGTCRMGPGPDSVVDAQLRVHGLSGLRVADASIMPNLVSGNTNAPTIMIGERAADLILQSATVDAQTPRHPSYCDSATG
jgi:choline dehydrogenase